MYDLEQLSLRHMTECGAVLRSLHDGAHSMEDVCRRAVQHLYEELRTHEGERACVLVRAYRTHRMADLEPELQSFAERVAGAPLPPDTWCLTLMATAGDEPAWNSRHASARHRAIPLVSEEAVERLPMIARLVRQLGLEVRSLLSADPDVIMDLQQQSFNVFYVPEANGSPYIPAQAEFVQRYGVRSVLGFGSVLPAGDLLAIILFSRVTIPRATAELFRPLALAMKLSALPFAAGPTFALQHA